MVKRIERHQVHTKICEWCCFLNESYLRRRNLDSSQFFLLLLIKYQTSDAIRSMTKKVLDIAAYCAVSQCTKQTRKLQKKIHQLFWPLAYAFRHARTKNERASEASRREASPKTSTLGSLVGRCPFHHPSSSIITSSPITAPIITPHPSRIVTQTHTVY